MVQQLEQTTSEPADAQEPVGQSEITGVTSGRTSQSNEELEEPINLVDYEAFESVIEAARQEDPFFQEEEEDEGKDKEEDMVMDDNINYDTIIQNLVNASTADNFLMHSQPRYEDPLLTFPHKIHSSLLALNSNDAADIGDKGDASGLNFCSYLIAFLAQILKSLFNCPVRAINYVIQVPWVLCDHSYRAGVEEGERRALARAQAPSNSQEARVDEPVNPSVGQPQTIRTYHTKLGLKSTPLTNPCCPNKDCHHIFLKSPVLKILVPCHQSVQNALSHCITPSMASPMLSHTLAYRLPSSWLGFLLYRESNQSLIIWQTGLPWMKFAIPLIINISSGNSITAMDLTDRTPMPAICSLHSLTAQY